MKKFTYIFLLASCLLLASCESWLDEDPQYTLNTQIQFSTSNIKYIDNQLVTVSKVQMICKCKYKTI